MSSNVTVRKASTYDIEYICSQLHLLAEVIGQKYSLLPERYEDAEGIITSFVTRQDEGFITWIAERWTSEGDEVHAQPVGFFVAQVARHPFNPPLKMCSALLFWVNEDARGSGAALRLMNAFLAHGKLYAHWTNFSCNVQTNISHESLIRRGFQFTERCYLMEN